MERLQQIFNFPFERLKNFDTEEKDSKLRDEKKKRLIDKIKAQLNDLKSTYNVSSPAIKEYLDISDDNPSEISFKNDFRQQISIDTPKIMFGRLGSNEIDKLYPLNNCESRIRVPQSKATAKRTRSMNEQHTCESNDDYLDPINFIGKRRSMDEQI